MKASRHLIGLAALLASGPAFAQFTDGVVRIGVLTDMSSLYSDIGGPGSVAAAKLAVADFGAAAKGIKVEIISGDHQNKSDVGAGLAGSWFDVNKVDMIVDVPNSGVALAVSEVARQKNKVFLVSGAATSDLTGPKCNANTVHWTYDTWMPRQRHRQGDGEDRRRHLVLHHRRLCVRPGAGARHRAVVQANGGKVLGRVRVPLNTNDFSSFLLQAQASQGQGDRARQCRRRHHQLDQAGGRVRHRARRPELRRAAGVRERCRGARPADRAGPGADRNLVLGYERRQPRLDQALAGRAARQDSRMGIAGVYASVLHYLKAVEALKADGDGKAVVAKMKELPTDDPLFGKGTIRADGRKLHDAYLFEVKKPAESKYPGDFYKTRATIPAAEAFRPLKDGGCPLVQG